MKPLAYARDTYQTAPTSPTWFARTFPSLAFYRQLFAITYKSSVRAKRGDYDCLQWHLSSLVVLRALESVGVQFEITGISHLQQLETPCVLIANHMSLLETMVLPTLISPLGEATFIVKQSLLDYPVFRHVMRSRDPIALSRTNPRQDLKAVLQGGTDRLKRGISIVVFPQTTRASAFDPKQFSTIGVKLAQRAAVPVVPLALLTDAWGNGRRLKDLGKIDPSKRVRFAFHKPIRVQGRGAPEHQQILQFIAGKLQEWKAQQSQA